MSLVAKVCEPLVWENKLITRNLVHVCVAQRIRCLQRNELRTEQFQLAVELLSVGQWSERLNWRRHYWPVQLYQHLLKITAIKKGKAES